jgi:hypothetical protein
MTTENKNPPPPETPKESEGVLLDLDKYREQRIKDGTWPPSSEDTKAFWKEYRRKREKDPSRKAAPRDLGLDRPSLPQKKRGDPLKLYKEFMELRDNARKRKTDDRNEALWGKPIKIERWSDLAKYDEDGYPTV